MTATLSTSAVQLMGSPQTRQAFTVDMVKGLGYLGTWPCELLSRLCTKALGFGAYGAADWVCRALGMCGGTGIEGFSLVMRARVSGFSGSGQF